MNTRLRTVFLSFILGIFSLGSEANTDIGLLSVCGASASVISLVHSTSMAEVFKRRGLRAKKLLVSKEVPLNSEQMQNSVNEIFLCDKKVTAYQEKMALGACGLSLCMVLPFVVECCSQRYP